MHCDKVLIQCKKMKLRDFIVGPTVMSDKQRRKVKLPYSL